MYGRKRHSISVVGWSRAEDWWRGRWKIAWPTKLLMRPRWRSRCTYNGGGLDVDWQFAILNTLLWYVSHRNRDGGRWFIKWTVNWEGAKVWWSQFRWLQEQDPIRILRPGVNTKSGREQDNVKSDGNSSVRCVEPWTRGTWLEKCGLRLHTPY